MFTELYSIFSDFAKEVSKGSVSISSKRIGSISSYSSNSIFYFPTIVTDQCSIEEVIMASKALEKQYAAFVVTCISLIPFHRIKQTDQGSIEEYLRKFHQNIGINKSMTNRIGEMWETANCKTPVEVQDFFMNMYKKSLSENTNIVKYISDNYKNINEMFNEAALDGYTYILRDRYNAINEEVDTWGFIGPVCPDDYIDENATTILDEGVKEAIAKIAFTLETVPDNKIENAVNLSKLRSLESKLNTLKNKYSKYLTRYKKKYKENKANKSKSKLAIRFNNMLIEDPKVFMLQYGEFISIINKKLKLCEKRRSEILKRRGVNESTMADLTDSDLGVIDFITENIDKLLNAPDSNIFVITEASSDARDDEYYKKDNQRLKDELKNKADEYSKLQNELKNANNKKNIYAKVVHDRNDNAKKSTITDKKLELKLDPERPVDSITGNTKLSSHTTFDREVFTKMDMQKTNEMVPTFSKANIGFIVDETEEVVQRDVLVGVKTYIHRVQSSDMVSEIYNTIINKRKFLKFVKYITGEERSLADLLFGIKELKDDAKNMKNGKSEWRMAFKRRKRLASIAIPYIMKEYTPNGTIVITMNEVDYIRDTYGIDLMKDNHIKMIMEDNFLLGFMILDQTNEIVYVTYDGHDYNLQEYPYSMLEREQQNSDRMMRELYRSFSK